jgi:hypothetical protein
MKKFLRERCGPIHRSVPQGGIRFAAPDGNASLKLATTLGIQNVSPCNATDHNNPAARLSKENTILWVFDVAVIGGHTL